jgi:hypothetical protein
MITSDELLHAARSPLLTLGARANAIREAAFGDRTYFAAQPPAAFELTLSSSASPEETVALLVATRQTNPPSVEPRITAAPGDTTGEAEIRLIALARLAFPTTVHVRANWTTLSDAVAQVALRFGADELAGFPPDLDRREIWRVIREAGREPYPCDDAYLPIDLPEPIAKLRVLPVTS